MLYSSQVESEIYLEGFKFSTLMIAEVICEDYNIPALSIGLKQNPTKMRLEHIVLD